MNTNTQLQPIQTDNDHNQLFNFNNQDLRIVDDNGDPWFLAEDVAEILDYASPSSMIRRLDEDEKDVLNYGNGSFANRGSIIINESGLYNAVIGSKKPEAKDFKRWITGELLPTLRKTGRFDLSEQTNGFNQLERDILSVYFEVLKPSDADKLGTIRRLAESKGADVSFLPNYVQSEGTLRSMTDLLNINGNPMSTQTANKLLIKAGLLAELERPSKGGKTKRYKQVTEQGQAFGQNLVSPQNTKETQPQWYEHKFKELLAIMEEHK